MASPARAEQRRAERNGDQQTDPAIPAAAAVDLKALKSQTAQDDAVQPSGVALIVATTPEGGLQVIPQIMGDTRITEMTTIIELGLKSARSMLGLLEG